MLKHIILLFIIPFICTLPAKSQNQTIPGKISTPYPTLKNIAIKWLIKGDNNQNGIVKVKYRKKGKPTWKEGMPLQRVPANKNENFKWDNKHAGSIFDLTPNTLYEVKLDLNDPDGGAIVKTVEVQTRAEPKITKEAEIIKLQTGTHDTLFTKSGTKDKPVVYQCDGGTCIYKFIDLRNKKWVFIEGVTVNNLRENGIGVRLDGAQNCVIRNSTINAVYGIVAYKPGATNCYISDNVITGTSQWANEAMGGRGNNIGEGIQMTGPGNVIAYNRVTGFRDNISTMEDSHAVNQRSIDIYNNDIYRAADDGIEADFCFSNCRIFRNRLTNIYVGLSSQPGLGGPNYFVRNVMYNAVHAAFKLKRYSQGDVILHNTIIKVGTGLGGNSAMDYAYFRNNLAIGGPTGGVKWGYYGAGRPFAADIKSPGVHSSFDYDAVGVYDIEYVARIGGQAFSTVEPHGVGKITLKNSFNNVDFPNPPIPARKVPDLRLKRSSLAIDAAVRIPNINGNFTSKAPDIGAYEFEQKMPHYGPRK